MSRRSKRNPEQRNFILICTLCVFVIMIIILLLFSAGTLLLQYTGLSQYVDNTSAVPFIFCAIASFAIGCSITPLILRVPLAPVNRLVSSMQKLASGHFEERVDLGNSLPMKALSDSFNTLASELQNTEMLRSDFINSLSHEFKTPIVSIRGFARILKRDDLPEAQRRAYLDIIEDESSRLAALATNLLNLNKLEKQQILTDVRSFNLSEQVRKCVLMLEKNWSRKELEVCAEFDEYTIHANPDLLGQVWLNLLDNAVKFSPQGGPVSIAIGQDGGTLRVSVTNRGPCITPEQQKRIFDRFYQADPSRSQEGTGVGLSIVKKIVELHRGEIRVESSTEGTTFTVLLPQK